jgi:hypothetical protein
MLAEFLPVPGQRANDLSNNLLLADVHPIPGRTPTRATPQEKSAAAREAAEKLAAQNASSGYKSSWMEGMLAGMEAAANVNDAKDVDGLTAGGSGDVNNSGENNYAGEDNGGENNADDFRNNIADARNNIQDARNNIATGRAELNRLSIDTGESPPLTPHNTRMRMQRSRSAGSKEGRSTSEERSGERSGAISPGNGPGHGPGNSPGKSPIARGRGAGTSAATSPDDSNSQAIVPAGHRSLLYSNLSPKMVREATEMEVR